MKVGGVQEARLRQAEIDERRLHPRQDADDLALMDVADDAAVAGALDVDLGEGAVLDQRDARFLRRRLNENDGAYGRRRRLYRRIVGARK